MQKFSRTYAFPPARDARVSPCPYGQVDVRVRAKLGLSQKVARASARVRRQLQLGTGTQTIRHGRESMLENVSVTRTSSSNDH